MPQKSGYFRLLQFLYCYPGGSAGRWCVCVCVCVIVEMCVHMSDSFAYSFDSIVQDTWWCFISESFLPFWRLPVGLSSSMTSGYILISVMSSVTPHCTALASSQRLESIFNTRCILLSPWNNIYTTKVKTKTKTLYKLVTITQWQTKTTLCVCFVCALAYFTFTFNCFSESNSFLTSPIKTHSLIKISKVIY